MRKFMDRFDHILVHLDIDVLDPALFHSTYFANPELVGDGSGGGRMTMDKLTEVLHCIHGLRGYGRADHRRVPSL